MKNKIKISFMIVLSALVFGTAVSYAYSNVTTVGFDEKFDEKNYKLLSREEQPLPDGTICVDELYELIPYSNK